MTRSKRFQVDPDQGVLGLVIVGLDGGEERGDDKGQESLPDFLLSLWRRAVAKGGSATPVVDGRWMSLRGSPKFIQMKCCIRYRIDG